MSIQQLTKAQTTEQNARLMAEFLAKGNTVTVIEEGASLLTKADLYDIDTGGSRRRKELTLIDVDVIYGGSLSDGQALQVLERMRIEQ